MMRFSSISIVLLVILLPLECRPADSSEVQIRNAVAWLQDQYEQQKRGVCPKLPCPLTKQWVLKGITSANNRIDIAFESPKSAPITNIERFKAGVELDMQMEVSFCPHGDADVYKIAKPPIEFLVHLYDPKYGEVASHKCSRRILY
jgi:hypothetical protein